MQIFTVVLLAFHFAKNNAANIGLPSQLTPVHGLFVKPSEDGVTGDLYVAASEDNGVTSQWLTDHPINFLPVSTQSQAASTPVTYLSSLTTSTSPHEKTVTTKKKAVITSPAVKYAYALPVPGPTDASTFNPYPFGFYAPGAQKSEEGSQCQSEVFSPPTGIPAYPYPFYYPHMMTALTAAMHSLREEEDNEKKVTSPLSHHWPGAYAYPYQYIMLDPAAWGQSESTTGKVTTAEDTDDD